MRVERGAQGALFAQRLDAGEFLSSVARDLVAPDLLEDGREVLAFGDILLSAAKTRKPRSFGQLP